MMQVPFVMQTRYGRLMFNYLKVDPDWTKTQVMNALRTAYFAQSPIASATKLERILLCQDMVVEIRDASDIVFDNEEAKTLPTRVFIESGAADQSLTNAFNNCVGQSKRAFRRIYPQLVTSVGARGIATGAKVLVLRRSFNRKRAIMFQLISVIILAFVGVGVQIVKQNAALGAVISGGLFALVAAVQPILLWYYR